MKERVETLRRRIATYRRALAKSNDAYFARLFLLEIVDAKAELARIEGAEARVIRDD